MPLWVFQATTSLSELGTDSASFTPDSTEALLISAIKLLFLLAFGLYAIFAFIATRQIRIMKRTVITSFSSVVDLIGLIHLGLALLVFIGAIFLL